MCGRFTLTRSAKAIAQAFELSESPTVEARYNIAPTQPVPAILAETDGGGSARKFSHLYWGLIPSWSKDPAIATRLINARSETVAEKPSFRTAFKRRRCLIVADGFYEWKREGKTKQPHFFFVGNAEERQIFAFAGLWEHWESSEGDWINSCTILTTEANDVLRPVHDRMPVILHQQDYDLWLDPTVQQTDELRSLLRPYDAEAMGSYAVNTQVNNARNDSAACVEPLSS